MWLVYLMYQAKQKSVVLALSVVTVFRLLKVSLDSVSAQTSASIKFEDLRSPCIMQGQFWLYPSSWVSQPCLVSFQYFLECLKH